MKWMILIVLCVFALFCFLNYRETGQPAALLFLVANGGGMVLNFIYSPDGEASEEEVSTE